MHLKKNMPVFFLLLLLLPQFFATAGLSAVLPGERQGSIETGYNRALLHGDILGSMEQGEEYIEVLIKMREQADTAKVAKQARAEAISRQPAAREQDLRLAGREAVVQALRQQAAGSQRRLLKYLLQEQENGMVLAIKDYYIANMVFVHAHRDLIRQLEHFPEIEMILPNPEFSLEEINQADSSSDTAANQLCLTEGQPGEPSPWSPEEWNVARVRAPEVWEMGYDGNGVVVGVIDTGVDWRHPALKEQWRGYNPENPEHPDPLFNWYDTVDYHHQENQSNKPELPVDPDGHGTHVAGIILGSDPHGDITTGVAPGAQWIAVNVFKDKNASAADILAAGEYLLAPYDPADPDLKYPQKAPDIINNSWGNREQNLYFEEMITNWYHAGILPVVSAGNYGPAENTIANPAHLKASLTVAATTQETTDKLWHSSSRGFETANPELLKPDLAAPGVNIYSALPDSRYGYNTGTSMAAPHVAGAAALLLSIEAVWEKIAADQRVGILETLLKETARPLTDSNYPESPNHGYGHGLLNTYAAAGTLIDAYLTPTKLTISGTFTVQDKVYDGSTAAVLEENNLTLQGLVEGDDVTLLPAAAFADATVGEDKTVHLTVYSTLEGADKDNYTLSLHGAPTSTATIHPTKTGSGNKDECFIATAAYGSPLAPAVIKLRHFRDSYLMPSPTGRHLVDLYYHHSPPLSQLIAETPLLQALVRIFLLPVIFLLSFS